MYGASAIASISRKRIFWFQWHIRQVSGDHIEPEKAISFGVTKNFLHGALQDAVYKLQVDFLKI